MLRYGVPYKGGKRAIAEWVVSQFPSKTHFYDLFAGGCSVTHAAMLTDKFTVFHANDITDTPLLFFESIHGRFHSESRWISRSDFERLKDTDAYVRCCWSFGNNCRSYLYSRDIEPLKKAVHYHIFFGDDRLLLQLGIRPPHNYGKTVRERYLVWRTYCRNILRKRIDLESLERQERQESLESLQRLQRLQSLESLGITRMSYDEVKIFPDSVVYCDIPYRNTSGYGDSKKNSFDYERFYSWCERQTEPCFVSEYAMPEDRFVAVAETKKLCNLCATKNGIQTLEKIFIPKTQIEMFVALFDFCLPKRLSGVA